MSIMICQVIHLLNEKWGGHLLDERWRDPVLDDLWIIKYCKHITKQKTTCSLIGNLPIVFSDSGFLLVLNVNHKVQRYVKCS